MANGKAVRRPTGVALFDSMIGGGFPDKAAVLIEGPPGSGKSTLCQEFIFTGLSNGESCIYISTNEAISNVVGGMREFGWDVGQHKDKIAFVDCYSWRLPAKQREPAKYQIPGPTSLNELSILIESAARELGMDKAGGCIVLDSVSDLLLQAAPEAVFRFMQVFVSLVRGTGATALIVMEKGLHPATEAATLNYLTDGTVELRLEGERRSIRVTRMQRTVHELKWIDFTISNVGLRVEEFFG